MSNTRTAQFNSRRTASAWTRNQNTVAFTSAVKLGPVTHTIMIALMITILGLVYLTQATRATGYSYDSETVNSRIGELTMQKSDLEIENARLTAIKSIEGSSVAKTMTTPSDTQHIKE